MEISKEVRDRLVSIISEIGYGATIIEIEKQADMERHTLAKYLLLLKKDGFIDYKSAGKAKIWFVNKDPMGTVLKKSPDRRNHTENMLLSLISQMPAGLILLDETLNIKFMNELMKAKYGEIIGQPFSASVLGTNKATKIDCIKDGDEICEIQVNDKYKNILKIKVSRMHNPDGTISVILLIEDITKKKKDEEELKRLSKKYSEINFALNESSAVAITDMDGVITYVNDAFCKTSKYSRDELIGQTHRIVNSNYHPPEFFREMWKTILSGNVWRGEIRNRAKDGAYYWMTSVIVPFMDSKGKPYQFIAIRTDITKYMGNESKGKHRSK